MNPPWVNTGQLPLASDSLRERLWRKKKKTWSIMTMSKTLCAVISLLPSQTDWRQTPQPAFIWQTNISLLRLSKLTNPLREFLLMFGCVHHTAGYTWPPPQGRNEIWPGNKRPFDLSASNTTEKGGGNWGKKKKPIQVLCDICQTTDRGVNVAQRLWDESPQDASDIFPTKTAISY